MDLPHPSNPPLLNDLLCAELAAAAYIASAPAGAVKITVGSDSCFVLIEGDVAVVSVKGTKSYEQWRGNVMLDWGSIAYGISAELDRFLNPFIASNPDGFIYWVGHSRGGALAQRLCNLHLPKSGRRRMASITFGTPRSFTDATDLPGVSYCLPRDPVPRVPWHRKGHRDPCTRKYLFAGGIDDEMSWYEETRAVVGNLVSLGWLAFRCLKGWTPWKQALDDWGWERHGIDKYLAALEALNESLLSE